MTTHDARWFWNGVAAHDGADGAVRLRHLSAGAELHVRGDRLVRGEGYADSPRAARRDLARVGAVLRLRSRGRYLVHAAGMVDERGRAFLIAGDSGSGKSTIAFALARAGWRVLGDDGVVVEMRERDVLAHPWASPIRVSTHLADLFRELAETTVIDDDDAPDPRCRAAVHMATSPATRVAGLLFVQRADRTALTALGATDTLAALVRQSPWVVLGDGAAPAHLDALRRLARDVPSAVLAHARADLPSIGRWLETWPAARGTVAP